MSDSAIRRVRIPDGREGVVIASTKKHGTGREIVRVRLDGGARVLTFFMQDCKEVTVR
jgi:hypothetical protein